jgi:hypothetical protein
MVQGQVSGLQQRYEPRVRLPTVSVWDFRLERRGEHDEPLPRVAVQMRGTRFDGCIGNGDVIEISGRWRAGTTLRPRRVLNRSTNAYVRARGATGRNVALRLVRGVFAVAVCCFVIAVVAIFVASLAGLGPLKT